MINPQPSVPEPLPAGPVTAAGPPLPGFPGPAGIVRLSGTRVAGDPAGLYRTLRQRYGQVAPVLLDGGRPAWLVLGYREVHLVASNPLIFRRDSRRQDLRQRIPDDWPLLPYAGQAPSVTFTEGAPHHRRAGAIGDALDAVDRAQLVSVCERTADQLIDQFAGDGAADLIGQYAQQIPLRVMARLLRLPGSAAMTLVRDITNAPGSGALADDARQRLHAQMRMLVSAARGQPGPDVPSRLLANPGAPADEEEVAIDLLVLAAAAQQPTADWIGNTLRLMLVDDQFSLALQGGRSSSVQALNEVLWKDTPMQNIIGGWAAQDCELGGWRIRRGDMLVLSLAAANADQQVQPDSLAERGMNRAHLSFGHGEHGCPFPVPELAEIIAKSAVEVLLDRIPDVALAVTPRALTCRPSVWLRGLFALPARFTATARIA